MDGVLGVTLGAGFLGFLGVYMTFDYWYDLFWVRGMKQIHEATVALSEDLFIEGDADAVWAKQIRLSSGFALVNFVGVLVSKDLFLMGPLLVVGMLLFQFMNSKGVEDFIAANPGSAVEQQVRGLKLRAAHMFGNVILSILLLMLPTLARLPPIVLSIVTSIMLFYFAWRLPFLWYSFMIRPARIKKFSTQMVDALTLMSNGMKSGLNVPQTLQIVVDEMPNPISQEFRLILTENRIGLTFEKAFENLGRRIPSEDVSMFVTSVNILRETGGNISETFDTIAQTIRERMKLQSKIGAMVAQGMMSAIIVGALPWGLGVMLYLIDPVRMTPLFTTPLGWVILLAILILEAIGFVVILKIVKIRV